MFFLLFMPVVIGLALAERVNQFKRESIQLLEEKVLLRTSELSDANQSITQSVNSASIIQNAILPKIDCNNYGFKEFEYLVQNGFVAIFLVWIRQFLGGCDTTCYIQPVVIFSLHV